MVLSHSRTGHKFLDTNLISYIELHVWCLFKRQQQRQTERTDWSIFGPNATDHSSERRLQLRKKGPTTWSNRLHLIVWYNRAKYTENFTGKNGHFPSQGGAHFNLEELKNNATGSTERVRKNTHHNWKQQHTLRLVPSYLIFTNRAENSRMLKSIHTKRAGHRMRQVGFKPATAPTPLGWIASQKVSRKLILSSHTHRPVQFIPLKWYNFFK